MKRIPPWGWFALLALAGFGVLVWNAYNQDDSDTSWTDPQQPPPMVAPAVQLPGDRPTRPYARDYPGSLGAWDGTVVGDV